MRRQFTSDGNAFFSTLTWAKRSAPIERVTVIATPAATGLAAMNSAKPARHTCVLRVRLCLPDGAASPLAACANLALRGGVQAAGAMGVAAIRMRARGGKWTAKRTPRRGRGLAPGASAGQGTGRQGGPPTTKSEADGRRRAAAARRAAGVGVCATGGGKTAQTHQTSHKQMARGIRAPHSWRLTMTPGTLSFLMSFSSCVRSAS